MKSSDIEIGKDYGIKVVFPAKWGNRRSVVTRRVTAEEILPGGWVKVLRHYWKPMYDGNTTPGEQASAMILGNVTYVQAGWPMIVNVRRLLGPWSDDA